MDGGRRHRALHKFRVAAELCEKNDAFVFNHNESLLYQWIEEYEPELFRRIEALVRQGRWHIMGGWFVQPDCNIPHGESIVRQISTGRRYFREKFRARSRPRRSTSTRSGIPGHCPDHGEKRVRQLHHLPSVPSGTGRGTGLFGRGFRGSEVRVLWMPGLYNSPLGQADKRILDVMERQIGEENGAVLWGVGNHGGSRAVPGGFGKDRRNDGGLQGTWRLCMRRRRSSSPPAGGGLAGV